MAALGSVQAISTIERHGHDGGPPAAIKESPGGGRGQVLHEMTDAGRSWIGNQLHRYRFPGHQLVKAAKRARHGGALHEPSRCAAGRQP